MHLPCIHFPVYERQTLSARLDLSDKCSVFFNLLRMSMLVFVQIPTATLIDLLELAPSRRIDNIFLIFLLEIAFCQMFLGKLVDMSWWCVRHTSVLQLVLVCLLFQCVLYLCFYHATPMLYRLLSKVGCLLALVLSFGSSFAMVAAIGN